VSATGLPGSSTPGRMDAGLAARQLGGGGELARLRRLLAGTESCLVGGEQGRLLADTEGRLVGGEQGRLLADTEGRLVGGELGRLWARTCGKTSRVLWR